jgi:hypothetical protein
MRYTLDDATIKGKIMFAREVNILDISMGGVCLKAGIRLEIGRQYTLKLEYKDEVLSLDGPVIWSLLREIGRGAHGEPLTMYTAGIKFNMPMNEEYNQLEKIITACGTDEKQELNSLGLNPKPSTEIKAMLNYSHSYRLIKFNLGSMLIQSNCEFEIERKLQMEIILHDNMPLNFVGRVIYCINQGTDCYDIGIVLSALNEGDRRRLLKFIDLLKKKPEISPNVVVIDRESKCPKQ